MKVEEFKQIPLRAHSFLAGIPLHSLDCIELPGGIAGMTIEQIGDTVGFTGEVEMKVGPVTQALFWLRSRIGRVLHWDEVPELVTSLSYISKLSDEDRADSQIEPGTPVGISRVLYQFDNERLHEIINRTVHCFWVMASQRK